MREVNDYKTQILIIESEQGLYFGFKNFQTNETMRVNNHLRDQERSLSDKNGIVIDFDGDGIEGYNFFISSSGSVGDATVTDEKERNWDWDADWQSAALVKDGVWYSETFIPWTIASMKTVWLVWSTWFVMVQKILDRASSLKIYESSSFQDLLRKRDSPSSLLLQTSASSFCKLDNTFIQKLEPPNNIPCKEASLLTHTSIEGGSNDKEVTEVAVMACL